MGKWGWRSAAPRAGHGLQDRDAPAILSKGDERNPYLESSCAVLELTDYDALDASASSTIRADKRPLARGSDDDGDDDDDVDGYDDDDDYGDDDGRLGTARTSAASGAPPGRPGVNLFDRRHVGLLVSVLVAGFLSSSLKRGLLQLMESDLELSAAQGDAAQALLLIPWSYSFLLGFLADVCPVLGSHRRAYVILGWVLTFLAFFAVAFLNYVEEYDTKIAAAASASASTSTATSPGAGSSSGSGGDVTADTRDALIAVYMALLMLASLGVILSILMAEVHVVALSRDREPLATRGAAVGTLLLTQFAGDTVGQVVADRVVFRITSLGITPLYSFRTVALFLMFLSLAPLPALLLGFRESPSPSPSPPPPPPLGRRAPVQQRAASHWRRLRAALGERSTVAVTRFLFLFVSLSEFSLAFPLEQLAAWCGVDAKAQSASNIIQKVLYVCAIAMWKLNALNVSWRAHLALAYVFVLLAPQLGYFALATAAAGARSATAYAIVDALQGYVRALIVALEVAAAAEVAPAGVEGAFVGAIVSIATIMRLLATACANALGYAIHADAEATAASDDADTRALVGLALAASFAVRALALFGLLFLPRQKRELQRLRRQDKQRRRRWRQRQRLRPSAADGANGADGAAAAAARRASCTIAGFAAAFCVSFAYNWLAIAPSTSCLALVGGDGC